MAGPDLTRRPTWRADLAAYLATVARARFRPGDQDCGLFAAGAVEAMTGHDLAADLRGTYRTLADGLAALEAAGFPDHVALAASHFEEIPPAFAAPGDLAVLPSDDEVPALGVVQGAQVYALRPSGLALVDRLEMKRAFRV